MTHICVGKLNIIGSDNGLSPRRCQAIIWTNAGILLIRPLGAHHQAIRWTNDGLLLIHWGRVTHICVGKLTIIGSDNDLSPGRRQAIIWTNAEILLFGSLETIFSEILIRIQTFSFEKMHLEMPSAKWRPFHLGLNILIGLLGTNFSEIWKRT